MVQAATVSADPNQNILRCRVCGSTGQHQTYHVREMMFGTREEFPYFLCAHCGCLQITEIPHNLFKYYPDNYYSIDQDIATPRHTRLPCPRAFLERIRVGTALFGKGYKFNKIAAKFTDLPREIYLAGPLIKECGVRSWNAAFLDVGCGSRSWWLSNLQALGFKNLIGVDPHIKNHIDEDGIKIYKSQIHDIEGQFDVITLHHSLEHIPDQINTLRAIKSRLKPRGHCLIRIPLVSSLAWEMYGTDWVELDAPRHLYLHSLMSIDLIGKKAGFELIQTSWDSGAFQFYGSEQYRRDIPLTAENSFWKDPSKSDFSYREMAEYSALAAKVNQEGRGGRGCFIFRIAN